MKRNQWTAFLLAALLFLGGAATGALAHRYYSVTTVNAKVPDRQRYLEEMKTRLKLDPAQVSKLESIMRDTRAQMKAVRDSYNPQMLQIKKDHIEHVRAILTANQMPAYEVLVKEREQRAHEQEERDRNSRSAR